jgi:hypothetical protein
MKKAAQEYAFEKDLSRRKVNLNDLLVTYVDIKYRTIWSTEFLKKVKWEFKD